MLKIDPAAFAAATEALMIAARSATDISGLRVLADTPHTDHIIVSRQGIPDNTDWPRICAITLGAIVALVNGPAHVADEVHLGSEVAMTTGLSSIATPSTFLGLKAVFRSMMPPDCVQRDGEPSAWARPPGPEGGEPYQEIAIAGDSERDAVRAWWGEFVTYAKARGGHEIIWRVRPECNSEKDFEANRVVHSVYARLFIAKVDPPEVTW